MISVHCMCLISVSTWYHFIVIESLIITIHPSYSWINEQVWNDIIQHNSMIHSIIFSCSLICRILYSPVVDICNNKPKLMSYPCYLQDQYSYEGIRCMGPSQFHNMTAAISNLSIQVTSTYWRFRLWKELNVSGPQL